VSLSVTEAEYVGNKAMRGGIVVGVLNSRYVRNRDKLQF